ncbi:S23 ribosomal protein [Nostoc commune NIES-4072]|uniref:S23 ribosomal protein n=1 Tax=Nostoc commune NIES-4072 TaxID=2005467 RepID=A0A2R5FHB8_NOSCO|nr:four helix bundle protein [Nostoc commune]BBD65090.1 S23 ribosomal protein [Nostoc commune HK-02]GBG17585.1 S23 ribosomal protein [Nostoc commune NIES-4072]
MRRPDFEDLEVYQLAEKLANEIWRIVKSWDNFTKDTIGKQIVRRVSASNFVALDTDKKLKTLSEYQFFIQNRTNCRK